jgi:hypothetical protein
MGTPFVGVLVDVAVAVAVIVPPAVAIPLGTVPVSAADTGALVAASSTADSPETMEIYPGTSGRTQGERKLRMPAPNATRTPSGSGAIVATRESTEAPLLT